MHGADIVVESLIVIVIEDLFIYYLLIYNHIPSQIEENNMLHKNIDKILV